MNVYDMQPDYLAEKWVCFATKNRLALPLHPWDDAAFFDAHPKIEIEQNLASAPRGSKLLLPDYTQLGARHPVFSERARRLLEPHLEGCGRWIELGFDAAPYWLFFITNVVDALDVHRSEVNRFADGRAMRVVTYVFNPEALQHQFLCTLSLLPGTHRIVTDTFVDLVRQHRLTGFLFQRLWSSDTGPVSSKLKDWEKPRITGLEPS
jgi:hypothetical protein